MRMKALSYLLQPSLLSSGSAYNTHLCKYIHISAPLIQWKASQHFITKCVFRVGVCVNALPWSGWSCMWTLCVQESAVPGKTPPSPPTPLSLPIPPAIYPCLAPLHPSFSLPAPMLSSLPTSPLPISFLFLPSFSPPASPLCSSQPPCPLPPLYSPSLLLSLALSFHGHFKWLQINQRHSTEFVSEPLLWGNEAIHPGVCHTHN